MINIIPHLWFDQEALEAAGFYVEAFPDSIVSSTSTLSGVPTSTGKTEIVSFKLAGQPFMAINAGPLFKFNPSISFILNFDPSMETDARGQLDTLWAKLVKGGKILMPLQEYPFSKHFGWVEDRYGLSWQLMLTDPDGDPRPFIIPALMFTGDNFGKAEEASDFYLSVFTDSYRGALIRYPDDAEPNIKGTVMFTDFNLFGTWVSAMDSALDHGFSFNEAISLLVACDTQEEIDYYWEKLTAIPEAEQCGWLKDRYGLSWQVWPTVMGKMMQEGAPDQISRMNKAFLSMKKFSIEDLEKAFNHK